MICYLYPCLRFVTCLLESEDGVSPYKRGIKQIHLKVTNFRLFLCGSRFLARAHYTSHEDHNIMIRDFFKDK